MLNQKTRLAASILAAAAALWLFVPSTVGCGGGVCSGDEQSACDNTHAKCVPGCGNGTKTGANGLPEADPAYQGCVAACNNDLCTCMTACGTECKAN